MYRTETLIVVIKYAELTAAWGVIGKPVLNNENYLLPLGWQEELKKAGIDFEVKEVELFEEIIEVELF
jgi:hypothetical protein